MAEGTALRFQRDELGLPLVMFMRDMRLGCGVCGAERVTRYYHQTDYHKLTVGKLTLLHVSSPTLVEGECEQCGEPLWDQEARDWTLTFGFPTGLGLIHAVSSRTSAGVVTEYALCPFRRFDAQMVPEFQVEQDQSIHVTDRLTEADTHQYLGRFLNVKAGWRRLFKQRLAQASAATTVSPLTSNAYAILANSIPEAEAALETVREDLGLAPCVQVALGDPIADMLPVRPRDWLSEHWYQQLEEQRLHAWAVAPLNSGHELFRQALSLLPAQVQFFEDPSGDARIEVPVDGSTHSIECPVRRVLAEALMSGAAPSDWTHLWVDDLIADVTSQGTTE